MGNKSEALNVVKQLTESSKQRYFSRYFLATVYLGLGDNDLAFEWLGKALEEHNEHISWLKIDPRMDPLRSDPRFAALLQRVGLAP